MAPEVYDELLDKAIVHHIALCGQDDVLALPYVVGHVIASNAQRDSFLRQPEKSQRSIQRVLRGRREHQHQCRQVAGGGQVQPP